MKNFSYLVKSAILAYFTLLFQDFNAQAPDKMSYQAVVRNASNALVANQAIGVRISVLKTSPAGTEVYKEVFAPNPTTSVTGLLSLEIGSGTPVTGTFSSIDWSAGPYFVKVEIDPSGGTSYSLTSNSQLLSVPYALFAKSTSGMAGNVNTIPRFTTTTTIGNSQIIDDGTSVGLNVGTLNSNVKFQVEAGAIGNTIRGTLSGVPATSIATAGSIYGESTTGIGVIGVSGSQNGVYGLSTGTLGGTVGVATGTGNGIWGVATGAGVAGLFDGGTAGRGIIVYNGASGFGTSTPTARLEVRQPSTPVAGLDDNAAIIGYSYSTTAAKKGGINGTYNTSNYGTGIHGTGYQGVDLIDADANFSTGNQDIGVYGSANTVGVEGTSIGGIGVIGYNRNSSFAATTGGGNTYGVYGYANTLGGATVPATRYGVYGYATGAATNYAGYFSGNVQITGSIAKGSGTFKIDHPLDPENKYLYHSFVESPDMMNVYNGNITTDNNGYATVKLPEYFGALNKDFRYQLTVIGTFANAIISEEIKDNTFVVRTDKPLVKVSWQVTGIRNDGYAKAHRVVPEVEKEPEMKGKYLHPVELGKSRSLGIDEYTRPKDASEIKKDIKTNNDTQKPASFQQNKDEIAGAMIKDKAAEK
ncbi:autotransporter outer membrane beta-barrel domain-containing protein [Chryseobacterium oryctis]|uniref:The GLUG motif-containing protein n=1 Tax=Chryseobacterium oryctis TaxID=2952618 RepID=A0ABT3HPY7_9FLAO|nr:hypothetical protein [Chryseobacterium oryctis]MCW3161851.1 hypothetical protein [Chryseobacterium oryctis]